MFRTEFDNTPKSVNKFGVGSALEGFDDSYLVVATGIKTVSLIRLSNMELMKIKPVTVIDNGFMSESEVRELVDSVENISWSEWDSSAKGIKDYVVCKS